MDAVFIIFPGVAVNAAAEGCTSVQASVHGSSSKLMAAAGRPLALFVR